MIQQIQINARPRSDWDPGPTSNPSLDLGLGEDPPQIQFFCTPNGLLILLLQHTITTNKAVLINPTLHWHFYSKRQLILFMHFIKLKADNCYIRIINFTIHLHLLPILSYLEAFCAPNSLGPPFPCEL